MPSVYQSFMPILSPVLSNPSACPFLDGVRKGECDLAMSGWGNNLPDPEYFFGRTFHSIAIGANNSSHYSNPKLDELLEKGLKLKQ